LLAYLRNLLGRTERSLLIAYGGWALLSLLLLGGTLTTLEQAENTERTAVLARAAAGAAALEQTLLRVFEAVDTLQGLAATRLRMIDAGNKVGAATIEQQLHDIAERGRFGILQVSILHPDGTLDWSSTRPGGPGWLGDRPPLDPQQVEQTAALTISPPNLDSVSHRWIVYTARVLPDPNGQVGGLAVVALDPLALSAMISSETDGPKDISVVQLRQGGAIIARSNKPMAALSQRVSPNDPVLKAAEHATGGQFRDMAGGVERLVGFRAPASVPIIVSRAFDTHEALADFYKLRRVVLAVMLALVVGALIATRLFLANFLLRQRLGEQALRDPLTGLNNRRYFAEVMSRRMESARRQGQTALVLLIDLDGFKQVNDTRGHPVGDGLLRQVAERLLHCVDKDDVVMRLGGDEFAVVRLGRTQRRDATSLARFIVNELSEIYDVESYQLRISASVGVAMPPDGGQDLNDLLRSADIALYFVKAEGGSAYQLFDPAMENTVRTRRALEVDLREAVGRGELEVYYQPLVQLEPRLGVRGADAVAPPHPRHGDAQPLHPRRRGDRSHRPHGRMGAAPGLPGSRPLARPNPHRGQPLTHPVRTLGHR